jgi:hypothetical protein
VEKQQRGTTTTNNKGKGAMKEKTKPLDLSDLLIESGLSRRFEELLPSCR